MNGPRHGRPAVTDTLQALLDKRKFLRQQLQQQRQDIELALQDSAVGKGDYPRSHTMRFVCNSPVLAAGMLAMLASVLVRARLSQVLPPALMITRLLQGLATRAGKPPTSHSSIEQARDKDI